MRVSAIILIALLLTSCAQTDPYKRIEPEPTPAMKSWEAGEAYVTRWPLWYKCVHTVTIDFGPVSRTLVGYLVVNEFGQFRLHGMTEQGLKLFDVARSGNNIHVISAADEFDDKLIANIVRDISRVFLPNWRLTGGEYRLHTVVQTGTHVNALLPFPDVSIRSDNQGASAHFETNHFDLIVRYVGKAARVDWYECRQANRRLYRVDHYEWREFDGLYLPSVIVLREPGIQSDGPPYKLTIKITELTPRDTPWPDRVFSPEGE